MMDMSVHLGAAVKDNKEMSTRFRKIGPKWDSEDFIGEAHTGGFNDTNLS